MGNDSKTVQGREAGKAVAPSSGSPARDTSALRNSIESLEAPDSMPVKGPAWQAYVDGRKVVKLFVLLRHSMFLITEDKGTHETSRVFVTPERMRIGDRDNNRFGPAIVESVHFDTQKGLVVKTNHGSLFSPLQDCQVTWVDED
jgi:hypothetical protein